MKHGIAFPDAIRTEKIKRHTFSENISRGMRSQILILFVALFGGILFFRIVFLQIIRGDFYRGLSDSNRIRTSIIYAPRGVIFDRNGIPLIYNIPGFRQTIGEKTKLLTQEDALEKIAKGDKSLFVDSLRQYPFKDAMAHVLGYVGQVDKEQLNSPLYQDYDITDFIGKTGIEYQYEPFLKGINGKRLVEVDASGKEVRILGQTDPTPGHDLLLTLDARLQQSAYDAMKDVHKGAVVVTTPNGEVLALMSKPSFDPNLFTLTQSYKATNTAYPTVSAILTGENQPLLDRAISGTYPPGSTFKIVMAAGALESKKIDGSYKVTDKGKITIGPYSYSNWYFSQYGRTEGEVDVVKALARSNDIFFYELAAKIGLSTIVETSKNMGVGKKLGIDLPGEASGVLPDEKWKQKNVGEEWYLGDTYIYGIGQGYLLTSPLQVNAWTQAIANGGKLYKPHLLKNAREEVIAKVPLSKEDISLIRSGMIGACDTGGTAWPLFQFRIKNSELRIDGKNILPDPQASNSAALSDYRHISIACKTGTAQHGTEETLPHAWITLYAPAYDPQIIITVLNESSGEGSSEAGPIAKKILESYFGNLH
ncbi:MAG: hypothetical protein HZC02_01455 [Candidatus Levybacteria bacterium]|nr:hypothetical protein [Candidatus Levybacteria bacterium]